MTGVIMQIVSFGVQDMYLTGKPQIIFFKLTSSSSTNFAIESFSMYLMDQPLSRG